MIGHLNNPNYMPGKVATVREFSEVYRANVCHTFKPSSCEPARSVCRIYIERVLGTYRLDEVKGEVPQLLVNELRRRGLSCKTIAHSVPGDFDQILQTPETHCDSAGRKSAHALADRTTLSKSHREPSRPERLS